MAEHDIVGLISRNAAVSGNYVPPLDAASVPDAYKPSILKPTHHTFSCKTLFFFREPGDREPWNLIAGNPSHHNA